MIFPSTLNKIEAGIVRLDPERARPSSIPIETVIASREERINSGRDENHMATRTKSEDLGLLGVQQNELFRLVRDGTRPYEDVRRELQRIIDGKPWPPADLEIDSADEFTVPVNYRRQLSTAVKAGQYDWVNESFPTLYWEDWTSPDKEQDHFPKRGRADARMKLIKPKRGLDPRDVIEELAFYGLRPANIVELLAFGECIPVSQQENPIIALGSIVRRDGTNDVAVLFGESDPPERKLGLHRFGGRWSTADRFLAVRA
jgi:hypothetical protein